MKKLLISLSFIIYQLSAISVAAQTAVLKIDTVRHQKITGFGAFVCSPSFQYNHMTNAEIDKVWGAGSTIGCNIMRLYIPIGRNAWPASLATAKYAKQKGLIVFASPWGQPAEWKTNNSSDAQTQDGVNGYLKSEHWKDYAVYLNDYVEYLRDNGVTLDAISIQNEPDWPAKYAGCLWAPDSIAKFVKLYGRQISCKIIAPEPLAINDSYANALNKDDVLPCFDIYGGHQYGGIQTAYKNLAKKGKDLWMTEYLINWNEIENTTRNFDWDKDIFNFARSINTCMLGDFNAWIHYTAKRYYGLIGDGTNGTSTGGITKRGYVMRQFSNFVTGMTRVESKWYDEEAVQLEGSTYINDTNDTIAVVIINSGSTARKVILDLPFATKRGVLVPTVKSTSTPRITNLTPEETVAPEVTIPASSVSTVRFYKSRDRYDDEQLPLVNTFVRLDEQPTTNSGFGTRYKLSGKTVKFDHNNSLLSSYMATGKGYIQLPANTQKLVMQVRNVTSTMNYSSSKTTLYYVNDAGVAKSHDYGTVDFSRRENFNVVFDLSKETLADGCKGLLSITNDNWSSTLTITFDDVYLRHEGDIAGISETPCMNNGERINDSTIYDLNGRNMGKDRSTLPKGLYIINGKKYVKS